MDRDKLGPYLRTTLVAGLEVSVAAALAALTLLVLLSRFSGMPWFAYGNLFATTMYSADLLEVAHGYHTFAGFSLAFLYLVGCGLLFAAIFPSRRKGAGPYLVGVFFALALFMAGDRLWWQQWSRYIVIYGVHSHLMWAHVVFGVVLGALGGRRARMEADAVTAQQPEAVSAGQSAEQ
jgi:predicted anti-sigma-YlaC factor YlaD